MTPVLLLFAVIFALLSLAVLIPAALYVAFAL